MADSGNPGQYRAFCDVLKMNDFFCCTGQLVICVVTLSFKLICIYVQEWSHQKGIDPLAGIHFCVMFLLILV